MDKLTIISIKLYLMLVGILVFSSCAMPPPMKDVEVPVSGEAIVFGRVDVYENGIKQEWKMKWTGTQTFFLMILPPGGDQAFTYKVKPDGSFNWSLKPGKYMLLGYRFQKGTRWITGRIASEFYIEDDVDGMYVGDIKISLVKNRYYTSFIDNYGNAYSLYKDKFPGRKAEPVRNVMKKPVKLGNYVMTGHQCHERWGVKCSKRYQGVTPINPRVEDQGFSVESSLTPTFKWDASSEPGSTYDMAIYEAVSYSVSGMDRQYMKGRLVVYRENIKVPLVKITIPLLPKKKYFWSVRLRDGDKVSGWSTFSYSSFYLLGMSTGYGKWFSFSTP